MKKLSFNPRELRPVRDLCADGTLPLHTKSAERLCRIGVIPAIKVGNLWFTTPSGIRGFYWGKANKAFRETHS